MPEDNIRQKIDNLLAEADGFAVLLAQVRDEGKSLSTSRGKETNWQWVDQSLTNVKSYIDGLRKSVTAHDPVAISYAAEQFVGMRKYFEDTSLAWSKSEAEVRQRVSMLTRLAGQIAFAINPFDPKNLQDIRKALA